MGDHYHLVATSQPCEPATDLTRSTPSDSRVDLIEDESPLVAGRGTRLRYAGGVGQHDLQSQHDAGQFTARGAFAQRQRRCTRMRDQHQADGLGTGGTGLVERLKLNDQSRPLHLQAVDLSGHGRLESAGQRPTRRSQLPGRLIQGGVSTVQRLLQRRGAVFCTIELSQPLCRSPPPGEECIDIVDLRSRPSDVTAGTCQLSASILNPGEPGRIGIQGHQVLPQLGSDVGGQNAQLAGAPGELGQAIILSRSTGQSALRSGEKRGRIRLAGGNDVLLTDQGRTSGARRQTQILGMVEPLSFSGEFMVLPRRRFQRLQRLQPLAQAFSLLLARLGPGAPVVQRFGGLAARAIGLGIAAAQSGVLRSSQTVQGGPLSGGAAQSELLGLSMYRHQVGPDVGEHGGGDRTPAQMRTRTTRGRHRAGGDEQVVVELGAGLPGPRGGPRGRIQGEGALDQSALGPSSHNGALGPLPKQKPERGEHHGLAGPGLSRQGGQTGAKRKLSPLDDAEILDMERLDHAVSPGSPESSESPESPMGLRQPSTGRSNLRTRRVAKGASFSRARRTGRSARLTRMREPAGASRLRRPSHQTSASPSPACWITTSKQELGPRTSGRVNRAWATSGTSSSASTSGQITGPPPE